MNYTNLGLSKPTLDDPANIEVLNDNWDLIDEELSLLKSRLVIIQSDNDGANYYSNTLTNFPEPVNGLKFYIRPKFNYSFNESVTLTLNTFEGVNYTYDLKINNITKTSKSDFKDGIKLEKGLIYNVTFISEGNNKYFLLDISTKVTLDDLTSSFILPIEKGGTGATTAKEARANLGVVPNIVSTTLDKSKWSDTDEYSFNNEYPVADYDLEISLDGTNLTSEQKIAFDDAEIVGYGNSNTIKALSGKPTIDIPVLIKVVNK